jgi:5-methylcytosine-specific restriction endonuclease McrA
MKTKKFNYKSYIRSALRRIWLWHPERAQTIRNARVAPGKVACRQCGIRMVETPPKGVKKEYEVDHIVPASEPASQIVSWDDYIKRLLEVTVKDLRVLCKGCHGKKTKTENWEEYHRRKKEIRLAIRKGDLPVEAVESLMQVLKNMEN